MCGTVATRFNCKLNAVLFGRTMESPMNTDRTATKLLAVPTKGANGANTTNLLSKHLQKHAQVVGQKIALDNAFNSDSNMCTLCSPCMVVQPASVHANFQTKQR
jgi:hypothetical protein